GRAALKQPCGPRNCRIEILGRDYRLIKPFERITHPTKLIETHGERVNGRTTKKKSAGHSDRRINSVRKFALTSWRADDRGNEARPPGSHIRRNNTGHRHNTVHRHNMRLRRSRPSYRR